MKAKINQSPCSNVDTNVLMCESDFLSGPSVIGEEEMINGDMRDAFERDGFLLVPEGEICPTRKPDHDLGTVSWLGINLDLNIP